MLNVAHVRFRPYPEMFGGILGSLDSVLPPGFSLVSSSSVRT